MAEARTAAPLHLRPSSLALVFAGGAAGTGLRYGVSRLIPTLPGEPVWSTLTANLVGAFVLGLLLEWLVLSGPDGGHRRRARLLIGTGLCGGLTTYSTFALDLRGLLAGGHGAAAAGYAALTVIGGIAVAAAGVALARAVSR